MADPARKQAYNAGAWHADEPYDAAESIRLSRACDWVREAAAALHVARRFDLLDIGCGIGPLRAWLPAPEFRIVGLELSARAAAIAGTQYDTCEVGDVEATWPFADASFDATHAGAVLEHVLDWHAPLNQANRVLRAGGVLLLSVPNLRYWKEIRRLIRGRQPHWMREMTHVHAYTPRFLTEILALHGFRVTRLEADRLGLPLLWRRWGCRRFAGWGSVLIVAARLEHRRRVEDRSLASHFPNHRPVGLRAIEVLDAPASSGSGHAPGTASSTREAGQ